MSSSESKSLAFGRGSWEERKGAQDEKCQSSMPDPAEWALDVKVPASSSRRRLPPLSLPSENNVRGNKPGQEPLPARDKAPLGRMDRSREAVPQRKLNIEDYLKDDELFVEIFRYIGGFDAIELKFVCKAWCKRINDRFFWKELCCDVWPRLIGYRRVRNYDSWQALFFGRPRVRFDGVYVFEHSFFKTITVGDFMSLNREVVKVAYYRYLRFLPHRRVVYALLNYPPERALSWIYPGNKHVHMGTFDVKKSVVSATVDVVYMRTWMTLEIENEPFFDRMQMIEFEGKADDELERTRFPVGQRPFRFHKLHRMK